jgi:predicted DNA-binding transcriptional regulator AlpA
MNIEQRQFGAMPLARQPQPRLALLTLDQVAQMLGTSKAWVRDHATRRNPRIPCVRLGGKRALLRFRPQDVEQFIDKHLICTEEYA